MLREDFHFFAVSGYGYGASLVNLCKHRIVKFTAEYFFTLEKSAICNDFCSFKFFGCCNAVPNGVHFGILLFDGRFLFFERLLLFFYASALLGNAFALLGYSSSKLGDFDVFLIELCLQGFNLKPFFFHLALQTLHSFGKHGVYFPIL